jgi:hypothetical protein
MRKSLVGVLALSCASSALALDANELKVLRDSVREMCVAPDRMGNYLRTEGEAKVGAPVLVKIIGAEISGKIAYEKWEGISIAADKYKTDPRQCAIEILKILQPAMTSSKEAGGVQQSSSGSNSPNISGNSGTINFNSGGRQ